MPDAQTPVSGRGHLVIRGATVLSMDPAVGDLERGDIEIADGTIVAVGEGLDAPGAESIDGRDRIAIPGFVDPHWHLWGTILRGVIGDGPTGYFPQKDRYAHLYRPDDTAAAVRLAAADGLAAGITTIHDWAHNVLSRDDAEADLGALRRLGVRARFSYGAPSTTPGLSLDQMAAALGTSVAVSVDQAMDIELAASLREAWAADDGLLTFGVAVRGPARSTLDVVHAEFAAARSFGLPIAMHCAGTRAEVERIDQITVLEDAGLLADDLLLAHANHLPAASIVRVAAHGIPITVSPACELRLAMGPPPVVRFRAAGIRVSFSLDSTAIIGAADPFEAMRLAVGIERLGGDLHGLTQRDALEIATIEGARSLGLGDVVGSISPGKRADVVLIATDRPGLAPVVDPYVAVVHGARPSDVRTVLVDGIPVVDEGRLLTADVDEIVATANAALAGLRERAAATPAPAHH